MNLNSGILGGIRSSLVPGPNLIVREQGNLFQRDVVEAFKRISSDIFTETTAGTVPAPGNETGAFLRDDGEWVQLAGLSTGVIMPASFAGDATVKPTGPNICYALYFGRTNTPLSSCQIRFRVTTAATSISWGEMAVATGPVVLGGNPVLTIPSQSVGDISGLIASTGVKTVTISNFSISANTDLWLLLAANASGTSPQFRGYSATDDVQIGVQATHGATFRPSVNFGTPNTFTQDATSIIPIWAAMVI